MNGSSSRGDDIYLAIERGLEASRTLVLCLSPTALGSDWVGLERSTAGRGNCGSRNLRFRDPANAGRRFIPVLLASFQSVTARTDCSPHKHAKHESPRGNRLPEKKLPQDQTTATAG